ncbi:MAG: hypothetical protein WD688_19600, partial [Candidatus Binatia bacterium]
MARPMQKLLFTLWRAAAVILVVSAVQAQEPGTEIPTTMPVYQPEFYPYESGERALYKASWNGIPVATAEIHATPVTIEG